MQNWAKSRAILQNVEHNYDKMKRESIHLFHWRTDRCQFSWCKCTKLWPHNLATARPWPTPAFWCKWGLCCILHRPLYLVLYEAPEAQTISLAPHYINFAFHASNYVLYQQPSPSQVVIVLGFTPKN